MNGKRARTLGLAMRDACRGPQLQADVALTMHNVVGSLVGVRHVALHKISLLRNLGCHEAKRHGRILGRLRRQL